MLFVSIWLKPLEILSLWVSEEFALNLLYLNVKVLAQNLFCIN